MAHVNKAETNQDAIADEPVLCAIFLADCRVYTYSARREGERMVVSDRAIVAFEIFWEEHATAARYASPTSERGH